MHSELSYSLMIMLATCAPLHTFAIALWNSSCLKYVLPTEGFFSAHKYRNNSIKATSFYNAWYYFNVYWWKWSENEMRISKAIGYSRTSMDSSVNCTLSYRQGNNLSISYASRNQKIRVKCSISKIWTIFLNFNVNKTPYFEKWSFVNTKVWKVFQCAGHVVSMKILTDDKLWNM